MGQHTEWSKWDSTSNIGFIAINEAGSWNASPNLDPVRKQNWLTKIPHLTCRKKCMVRVQTYCNWLVSPRWIKYCLLWVSILQCGYIPCTSKIGGPISDWMTCKKPTSKPNTACFNVCKQALIYRLFRLDFSGGSGSSTIVFIHCEIQVLCGYLMVPLNICEFYSSSSRQIELVYLKQLSTKDNNSYVARANTAAVDNNIFLFIELVWKSDMRIQKIMLTYQSW